MTQERRIRGLPGYLMLLLLFGLLAASIAAFVVGAKNMKPPAMPYAPLLLTSGIVSLVATLILFCGFFIVNPNEARALVLFGVYRGTIFENGFWWANPFLSKKRISLRARNHSGETLKVNDNAGNPIEIAVVVVWRIKDTFRALFEVDDYVGFVKAQSEAAVRQLAGSYPYDAQVEHDEHDTHTVSLRAGQSQVNAELVSALTERLSQAGVEVIEARLSHLAYAPEIAGAMLQRQQAKAVVAARTKIVDGAVGMVRLALQKLADENVVELDPERKAAMVSNLLVVLCAHEGVQPVVNAGTLYT